MLGKLIKYDMKALNRLLILIHAFVLFASILIRFLCTGNKNVDPNSLYMMIGYVLYILLVGGSILATYLIIGMRFYKNMFSDEGYLTLTLPVSRGKLLLSKTIVGTIWGVINMIVFLVSTAIVALTRGAMLNSFRADFALMKEELGFSEFTSLPLLTLCLIVFVIIGALSNIIAVHAAVCLGQLFTEHKALGAVAAYFALSTVVSLISLPILMLNGLTYNTTNLTTAGEMQMNLNTVSATMGLFATSMILSIVISIILYLPSYFILKKKVNLS